MSKTNKRMIFQLFILVTLIGVCVSRPNDNVDNQDLTENNQSNLQDLEKVYAFYKPLQYYTYYDEPNVVDRTQLEPRSNYYPISPYKGSDGGNSGSLSMWDANRLLMSKRQARYRQCYFNPISCFRK